jgi:general secretion pathway protein I
MKRLRGFSLMEVLVAMMIAATALVALFAAAGSVTQTTVALRDRTYAQLVASNQIAELRARRGWPAPGEQTGQVELAGRTWTWRATVSETEDPAIRRIDYVVLDAGGAQVAALIGFLGAPSGG